jgi:DNA polymerase III subunit beta
MKFTVQKQAILEALQIVGSVVAPRAVRPILNNVHVVIGADGVATLMATDLEISIRYRLPLIESSGAGEAVIPAARALNIIRETAGDQLVFSEGDPGRFSIQAGRSTFDILSDNPTEFPSIPEFRSEGAFTLERNKLLRLIRKTQFAVAKEKSRFGFNGAMLHITQGEARMIATDGKRLAFAKEQIEQGESLAHRPLVPLRALGAFDKLMSLDEEAVQINVDEREIMLRTRRAEMSSRLVEGAFPDYQTVIPKDAPIKVRFNRIELASAFRQAAILTSQESRSVRVHLADGRAILRSQAPDAGSATIEIDAPDFQEEALSIAFNPDYFDEGLKVMEVDVVTFGLGRSNQPATITGEDGFVYVVMPITLRSA